VEKNFSHGSTRMNTDKEGGLSVSATQDDWLLACSY
jgi:hypothetical protein